MNNRTLVQAVIVLSLLVGTPAGVAPALAQPPAPANTSARDRALVDLTGQWVAVVDEDWRWRMITAPVGDTSSLPMNAEGRKIAAAWNLDKDKAEGNLCRAFGAPGIIRQPTRMRIAWQDKDTLKMEFDAGKQERLLHFAAGKAPDAKTLQGYSSASWFRQRMTRGVLGKGARSAGGSLHVETTHLAPGYLRPNGVPYSDQTTMKEYYTSFTLPGNQGTWLVVTTVVQDPLYLTQELVISTQFKKETNQAGWNPRPCEIQPPRVVLPPTTPGPFG